jgi:hypothetical protein
MELTSVHFLFQVWLYAFPDQSNFFLLLSVLASHIVSSTGMVSIESFLYQYWHSANANTGTGIYILPIPVLVVPVLDFFFANGANTGTGILLCANTGTGILFSLMPVLIQSLSNTSTGIQILPIPVPEYIWCPYWYFLFLPIVPIPVRAYRYCQYQYRNIFGAHTGIFYFCQSCQYQYGHFLDVCQYWYGACPIPVLACQYCQYQYLGANFGIVVISRNANTGTVEYQLPLLIIFDICTDFLPPWQRPGPIAGTMSITKQDRPVPRHAPSHTTSGQD